MPTKKMRLGDILIQSGIITQEQLDHALILQKEKNKEIEKQKDKVKNTEEKLNNINWIF